MFCFFFFFFKQKTAYEITVRDWSSDVCSSDLTIRLAPRHRDLQRRPVGVGEVDRVAIAMVRSEERRVGKECGLLCRSEWSPSHFKKHGAQIAIERPTVFESDCCRSPNRA